MEMKHRLTMAIEMVRPSVQ